MPLSDSARLVKHAAKNHYAVATINTNGGTYDIIRAIVEVANEEEAPVILGGYQNNLRYRGFEYTANAMSFFARKAIVPVATHLDHGSNISACKEAIETGFTSVMFDGSKRPIDENVAMTKEVVALASGKGVSVEAEIGELQKLGADGQIEEVKSLTDPKEVRRMSEATERTGEILGARKGVTGVLNEDIVDLRRQPKAVIEGLRDSPGAALGSYRYKITEDDYPKIMDFMKRHDIRYFFYNGGNDSMDTANKVKLMAEREGYELYVIGVPKTIVPILAAAMSSEPITSMFMINPIYIARNPLSTAASLPEYLMLINSASLKTFALRTLCFYFTLLKRYNDVDES